MGQRRLTRRLTRGLPAALLAALLLFARLVAPQMAMAMVSADPALALGSICHADAPGAPPGQTDGAGHGDCLLCPACHLLSHAALPTPAPPILPTPTLASIGTAAPLPPATAPPRRARTTAQPTGPPDRSA